MHTKLFWVPPLDDRTNGPRASDRRTRRRSAAGFYAVELHSGGRYLRRVANVSRDGLMLESPLSDEQPGQVMELELPRRAPELPVRVRLEVLRVCDGTVAMRRVDGDRAGGLPVDVLGGQETL